MCRLSTADRARLVRALALLLLALISAWRMPYAAVHMDLARDVFIAWRTLHDEALPLSGPVLAASIHLGPVWYWLLIAFLAIGRSWLAVMLLLGLLAGAQFGLAYLAGKELHSRRAGALWAALLLVPGWSAFEWVFPLHYVLSSACVLAFLLCAIRYMRRARRRYLAGMALCFALALHAHPANAGLVWIGAAILGRTLWRGECDWRDLLVAGGVGLLPLLPYLLWDAAHGFADLAAGVHYLGGEHTGHLSSILPLLGATAIGGSAYWFGAILHSAPSTATLAIALIAVVGIAGLGGAAFQLAQPRTRNVILAGIGAALAIVVTTALLRDMTPYYMTTALRVVLAGIVAIGLAACGRGLIANALHGATFLIAGATFLASASRAAHLQKHGDWPFNFFPLFDVTQASQPMTPLPLMPAYGVAESGRFLCAQSAPSAHGAFAQYLLHGYAIDMRLACGHANVKLGGAEPERQHWLGLSRAMFKQIGVVTQQRLGSLGVVRAQPQSVGPAIDPPTQPVYPAYLPKFTAVEERHIRIEHGAERHIAVSNIAFAFAPDPEIVVTVDGRPQEPIARDSVSRIYARGDGAVEITIRSIDAADVDVVTF